MLVIQRSTSATGSGDIETRVILCLPMQTLRAVYMPWVFSCNNHALSLTSNFPLLGALIRAPRYWTMGKHTTSAWRAGVEPMQIHAWPYLPPFSVQRPGATRVPSALLCYTVAVPSAQHRCHAPTGRGSARARGKPRTYGRGLRLGRAL